MNTSRQIAAPTADLSSEPSQGLRTLKTDELGLVSGGAKSIDNWATAPEVPSTEDKSIDNW